MIVLFQIYFIILKLPILLSFIDAVGRVKRIVTVFLSFIIPLTAHQATLPYAYGTVHPQYGHPHVVSRLPAALTGKKPLVLKSIFKAKLRVKESGSMSGDDKKMYC